jgi:hypothetical protein
MSGTVKTDAQAVSPTSTAKAAFQARGADVGNLMTLIQAHAIDLIALTKQVIAIHPADGVLSATVNAAGSGGTNGLVTITGTTGTGTKFTARGLIAAGALTGPLTIVSSGSYTVDPTSLVAEPVTGGSLTGATVGLTMSGDLAVLTSLNTILGELL